MNGGSNNIFELLDIHHNMGPGILIKHGGNNLILNSDSHHNYDPNSGNSAVLREPEEHRQLAVGPRPAAAQ